MIEMEISEQTQQLIAEFQARQQHVQLIITQLEAMKMQLIETEESLEELAKTNEECVYKSVGTILIKTEKEDAQKDLNERKDLLSLRIQTLEKEERKIKEKLKELQQKIQESLSRTEKNDAGEAG